MDTQGLIDPLQLELFDQMFPFKNNLSYGYNLKNARNEKSRSNNTKMGMPSLGLKSKFKQQFEFSENLEDISLENVSRSCSLANFSIQIF